MKKIALFLVTLLFSVSIFAQPIDMATKEVPPRRENLKDFIGKTTKIVLSGDNSLLDLLLKDAVDKGWYVSPFEFCSVEQFEKEKSDTNYYFLVRADGKIKKEKNNSIEYLSLLKGSNKVKNGIENMPEILSLPLQFSDNEDGKVFMYLSSYIKIIQTHVQKVINNNLYAYLGMLMYTDAIESATDKNLMFLDGDFAFPVTEVELERDFKGKGRFVSEKEMDRAITDGTPNTIVSLIIAPASEKSGVYCYKMLISTDTQELLFYRQHKISKKNGAGFLKEDYRRMSVPFLMK